MVRRAGARLQDTDLTADRPPPRRPPRPMELPDLDHPVGLFPLASCPLLPAATIPLHVIEPRYRQLTQDAIEHERPIAMAMFEGDDYQQDYLGQPPIRPVVCLGHKIHHPEIPAGQNHNHHHCQPLLQSADCLPERIQPT